MYPRSRKMLEEKKHGCLKSKRISIFRDIYHLPWKDVSGLIEKRVKWLWYCHCARPRCTAFVFWKFVVRHYGGVAVQDFWLHDYWCLSSFSQNHVTWRHFWNGSIFPWVLTIMPKITVISVGIQMERPVSVSSDRNIRDHFWGRLFEAWLALTVG